jgi:glycosyltransferase involved in cell wall biosynthesis
MALPAAPTPVLFVEMSPYPSYGGTKVVLVNLLRCLDRTRFLPRALVYRDGPWVTDLQALGVPVTIHDAPLPTDAPAAPGAADAGAPPARSGPEAVSARSVRRSPLQHAAWELRSWWHLYGRDARAAARFARYVPRDTRLIHLNHSLVHDFSWYHVARGLGVPFVLHEHGAWRPRSSAYRRVALRAASVVCLTEERERQLRALLGPRARTDFVPNGIPTDALRPRRARDEVRAELGVPPGSALIITAGHLQAWKGQALAVEAAAALAVRGVDFRWLLCGAELETAYVAGIRRRIAEANLGERVRLLGERSDLPDLFAASDLAVHTSIEPEPFGLVVVEAMLQGLAVVGPREGAIPSIVRDGVDGLLVPPRNAEAMAGAIAALVAEPQRRQAMGRSGRERVLATYDVSVMARRMEAVYERALAGTA